MRGGGCGSNGDGCVGCSGDGGCGGCGRVSLDVVVVGGGGVVELDVVVAVVVVVGGISAGTLLLKRPRWRRLSLAMLYACLVLGESGAYNFFESSRCTLLSRSLWGGGIGNCLRSAIISHGGSGCFSSCTGTL